MCLHHIVLIADITSLDCLLQVDPYIPRVQAEVKPMSPHAQIIKLIKKPRRKRRIRHRPHPGGAEEGVIEERDQPELNEIGYDAVQAGRQRAIERVKVYHKKKWYNSLTEKEKKRMMWRREAYRQAQVNAQRRRKIVIAAAFRYVIPSS